MVSNSIILKAPPLWNSCRLTYTACVFAATMNLMFVKLNISFALVCMIPKKDSKNTEALFHWDTKTQGNILNAFFYGYLISLVLGGWLSQKFFGKRCFVFGNAGVALLNFIIPTAALGGPWYLFAVRFFQGIFSGIMLPAIQGIFVSWTHFKERTKLIAIGCTGYSIGIMLVNPIASLFCYANKEMGWSYIFYFTGVVSLSCAIGYYFLVFDSVRDHPRISDEERDYLLSGINSDCDDEKKEIPYKSIFTSIPVYAYLITHCCQVFGYAALSTTFPKFLQQALSFSVIENGFISAIPQIISTITRSLIGNYFYRVQKWSKLSLTRFRKVNHVIGTIVPAIIFLTITFIPSDNRLAIIILFCTIENFCDFGYCGSYFPSFVDIAPNFTGFLTGVATATSNLSFIGVNHYYGFGTVQGSYDEWKVLWYICSGTYVIGCIVYVLFGTSEKQHWG